MSENGAGAVTAADPTAVLEALTDALARHRARERFSPAV